MAFTSLFNATLDLCIFFRHCGWCVMELIIKLYVEMAGTPPSTFAFIITGELAYALAFRYYLRLSKRGFVSWQGVKPTLAQLDSQTGGIDRNSPTE
jgi:hypothetical protein